MNTPLAPAGKFSPPRIDPAWRLPRTRVIGLLRQAEARGRRIFFVQARAGQGKTTLAIHFLTQTGSPFAWYRIGSEDQDPISFRAALLECFHRALAGFRSPLLEAMLDKERSNCTARLSAEPTMKPGKSRKSSNLYGFHLRRADFSEVSRARKKFVRTLVYPVTKLTEKVFWRGETMEESCPYCSRCVFFANYGGRSSRTWKNLVALYCRGGLRRFCTLHKQYAAGALRFDDDVLPNGEDIPLPFHALP
jgi:hypothetical protein